MKLSIVEVRIWNIVFNNKCESLWRNVKLIWKSYYVGKYKTIDHCKSKKNLKYEFCKFLKRRHRELHYKTLCQCSSRAGYNYQPISVSIHKVWTNQKPGILALALSKSDRGASLCENYFIKIKSEYCFRYVQQNNYLLLKK